MTARDDDPGRRAERQRPRGLPQRGVPAPLAVAGRHPDRRQHGPVRPDRHRRRLDRLQHRGQPADPDVPRPGGPVLGGRRRLRRPHRPADRSWSRRTSCAASRSSPSISPATTSPLILLLNIFVSTVTVFFAPAEAAMIPQPRPAEPAAGRERHLHADPERRVRARVRAARAARREHRLAGGRDPRRRRAVLPRRGLLLHAPVVAAATRRGRPRPRRGRGGAGDGLHVRPAARGDRVHPRRTARSPGRSSTSGSRRRSSACSACSGPDFARRDARPRGEGLRGRRAAARVRHRDRHPAAQLSTASTCRAGGSSRAA